MNSNIRDFIKAIQNANKTATSAYDTAARVTRVEGSTAWVHVEGGVEETPVEMSISCEPGDDVRVRINKGAAYIIGNNTNPPTNDRIIVKYAADLAQAAREVANRAFQNLQELLQTYVNKGSSNIDVLSTAMNQDENGTNVYGDISTAGAHYVKVNESGMDVRRVAVGGQTKGTDPATAHIGTDYVALGERAEGEIGDGSYSEGKDILNSGKYSHVEGYETQIKPRSGGTGRETAAHVEGYQTYIQAVRSNSARRRGNHVEGYQSYIGDRNDTSSGASYIDGAHVEGRYTSVNSHAGHAEGSYSWVTGESGHAEGNGTEAAAIDAHAEGSNTKASGYASHSEGTGYVHGDGGVASGAYSHHENYDNVASGNSSHASGYRTIASGNRAATFGSCTQASHSDQFAIGRDNVDKDDTYFEIGNGASTSYRGQGTPANVFEITRSGYLRTGQGMTDIGFGKESGNMGYYEPGSSGAVFTPWVPLVNGKIPETFLPSYVDDVIEGYYNSTDGKFYEESTYQTEIAGERGKIYIALDTDKSYRWSGSVFVELTSGGVVYSAGSGIDISATNEISADNTIARMTDLSGYLPLAGGTMTGAINSQHIVPATDDSYRLGSSSSKYNSAYVKRIYNLASIESTTDGSKRLLVPAKSGTIAVNEDLPNVVGNLIAVNPVLTSGVLIANVTVSGVSKNLYAPGAGDGIDISNNEISVDNTIARVSELSSYLPIAGGTISGSLEVENDLEIDGDFVANGDADIAGDLELSGDLIVENIINSGGVSVNGSGFVRENNASIISTDVVATNVIEAADVRFGSSPNEEVLIDSAGDLSGGSVDTTPTSGSNHIVTSGGVASALAGKQDALTAGAGLAISNAIVKTNITANDDWQDTAYEKGAGVFAHKYENANTTTYNLPSGFCFVIVYRYSSNRGVAYATYWASGGGSPKTWVNALHDDTAPYNWTGWKQMYTPETIGGATTPTYLNAGVPTACSAYAGGTNVTLNGSNKGASTASFYAPTSAGTTGYFLKSNGSGAPTWAAVPSGGGITISEIYPSDSEYKVPLVDNPYFDCVLPVNNNITSVSGLVTYISNYGFIPIRNKGYYQGSPESWGYGKPAVELLGTDKNQNGIVLQGQGLVGFGIGSIIGNWPGWYIFVLSYYNTSSLTDTVSSYGSGLYKHHFKINFKTGVNNVLGARIH